AGTMAVTLRKTSLSGAMTSMNCPSRKRKTPPPNVPIQILWLRSSARENTQEFVRPSFSAYNWKRCPSNHDTPPQLLATHSLPSLAANTAVGTPDGRPSAAVNIFTAWLFSRKSPRREPTHKSPSRSKARYLAFRSDTTSCRLVAVTRYNAPD